jgi:hypothetical protein
MRFCGWWRDEVTFRVDYTPPFTLTTRILDLVERISDALGRHPDKHPAAQGATGLEAAEKSLIISDQGEVTDSSCSLEA